MLLELVFVGGDCVFAEFGSQLGDGLPLLDPVLCKG
jgi:hypothetical protein